MHGIKEVATPDGGTVEPLCVTVPEIAGHLRVTERFVWTLIARGDLESLIVGKRRVVLMATLKAYVDQLQDEERQLRKQVAKAGA